MSGKKAGEKRNTASPAASLATGPADPHPEFVFELTATLEKPLIFGHTGVGERRIIRISGGIVRGPALNGVVLPGGADWQIVRDDGVS